MNYRNSTNCITEGFPRNSCWDFWKKWTFMDSSRNSSCDSSKDFFRNFYMDCFRDFLQASSDSPETFQRFLLGFLLICCSNSSCNLWWIHPEISYSWSEFSSYYLSNNWSRIGTRIPLDISGRNPSVFLGFPSLEDSLEQ